MYINRVSGIPREKDHKLRLKNVLWQLYPARRTTTKTSNFAFNDCVFVNRTKQVVFYEINVFHTKENILLSIAHAHYPVLFITGRS